MGYKLSGFEVLGGVEIDPKMMAIYKANHSPKHSYLMGVQDFNKIPRDQLPKELFDLDILDGSPPCSSFSTAGSRDKAWGKAKKFNEGQAVQVLDDLFFHFIETARILQPKVVVAENVKGLIIGKAKGYVKQIAQLFNHAGYDLQLFLLNAAFMGVPQRRERTFFIAKRKDLKLPILNLKFKEKTISIKQAWEDLPPQQAKPLTEFTANLWRKVKPGKPMSTVNNGKGFTNYKLPYDLPSQTLAASGGIYHPTEPRNLSKNEILRVQSYPEDFNFLKSEARYVCGMSVPPYMMNRISKQVQLQWLDKLK